jgi:gluconate 5-dehydrogenase
MTRGERMAHDGDRKPPVTMRPAATASKTPRDIRDARHSERKASRTQAMEQDFNSNGGGNDAPQSHPFGGHCPFQLDREVALITGGGTGLGLGIARCMAQAGARVVLAGRREEVLAQAARELGPSAFHVICDVTDLAAAPGVVRQAQELAGGPVTILVNNAGNHLKKPALETTDEEFARIMDTHVAGAFALTRAAAAGMVERGRGNILFIASMATLFGIPGVAAYSAAKSALGGLARALATELSPHGARVNAIAPGWIEGEMTAKAMANDPARRQKILDRAPMHRFGKAEDVGWAAVYLCSEAARFVTGVVLPVDGGISIGF